MTAYGYDDIDDSLAANPEESHEATTAPRGRRVVTMPTHWTIVERPGASPERPTTTAAKTCAAPPLGCGEPTDMLHATGTDPRRKVCGKCQGRINREQIGWAQAAELRDDKRDRR